MNQLITSSNIKFIKNSNEVQIILELDYETWETKIYFDEYKYYGCSDIEDFQKLLEYYILKNSNLLVENKEDDLELYFTIELGFKKVEKKILLIKTKSLTEVEKLKIKIEEKIRENMDLKSKLLHMTSFPPNKKFRVKSKSLYCSGCNKDITLDNLEWEEIDEDFIYNRFTFDM